MSFYFDQRCTPITIDREEFEDLLSAYEHYFEDTLCIFETDSLPFMKVCALPTDWGKYTIGYIPCKGGYAIYESLEGINELYNMDELSSMLGDAFSMPKNQFVKYLRDRRKDVVEYHKDKGEKVSNDDIREELLHDIINEEWDYRDGQLETKLQEIVYDFYSKKCDEFISKLEY